MYSIPLNSVLALADVFHVLPVHAALGAGRCGCGKANCQSPGKHPMLPNGVYGATQDKAKIRDWHRLTHGVMNVGVRLGLGGGVLDVDPRNGGNESLARFTAKYGPLPRTPHVRTGGDGDHFYGLCPAGTKSRLIGPGLEFKGDGSQVVAAPSLHPSGKTYAWTLAPSGLAVGVEEVPMPVWPDWVLTGNLDVAQGPAVTGTANVTVERNVIDLPGDFATCPGEKPGGRHQKLLVYAGRHLGRGEPFHTVLALALDWNRRNDPPLADDEVAKIVSKVFARHVQRHPQHANVGDAADVGEGSEHLAPAPAPVEDEVRKQQRSAAATTGGVNDVADPDGVDARKQQRSCPDSGDRDSDFFVVCGPRSPESVNAPSSASTSTPTPNAFLVCCNGDANVDSGKEQEEGVQRPSSMPTATHQGGNFFVVCTPADDAPNDADDGLPTLADDAFVSPLGEAVLAVAEQTEVCKPAILFALATAFGNAIGQGPAFRVGATQHGTALFTLLDADTGSGKGDAVSQAMYLMTKVTPEWAENCIANGFGTGEGFVERLQDDRLEADDKGQMQVVPGARYRELLVIEEEAAKLFRIAGREGGILSPLIRTGWDGKPLEILNRRRAALRATDYHASILAAITPDELRLCLKNNPDAFNGFSNRFLYAHVWRERLLPDGGDVSVLDAFVGPLQRALTKAKTRTTMARTPEAERLWRGMYAKLAASRPGAFGKATERARPQVLRLSLIFALADEADRVDEQHLRAALAMWAYSEASAALIFTGKATIPQTLSDRLLAVIRAEPGLPRSRMYEKLGSPRPQASELASALAYLEAAGQAHGVKESTGGRSVERWYPGRRPGTPTHLPAPMIPNDDGGRHNKQETATTSAVANTARDFLVCCTPGVKKEGGTLTQADEDELEAEMIALFGMPSEANVHVEPAAKPAESPHPAWALQATPPTGNVMLSFAFNVPVPPGWLDGKADAQRIAAICPVPNGWYRGYRAHQFTDQGCRTWFNPRWPIHAHAPDDGTEDFHVRLFVDTGGVLSRVVPPVTA